MLKETTELFQIEEEIKKQYSDIAFTEAELYILARKEQKRRCTEIKRKADKEALESALAKIAQSKQLTNNNKPQEK
jgi:hypothetical protein